MNESYGPWTTALHSGSSHRLSAFWQTRLTRLSTVHRSAGTMLRWVSAGLLFMAAALVAMPTLHGWAASAETEGTAPCGTPPSGDKNPAQPSVPDAQGPTETANCE
jgi:hypothetical protein